MRQPLTHPDPETLWPRVPASRKAALDHVRRQCFEKRVTSKRAAAVPVVHRRLAACAAWSQASYSYDAVRMATTNMRRDLIPIVAQHSWLNEATRAKEGRALNSRFSEGLLMVRRPACPRSWRRERPDNAHPPVLRMKADANRQPR